jgi:CRP/FNR family cyclic AMP-dependent transcriptional regulator
VAGHTRAGSDYLLATGVGRRSAAGRHLLVEGELGSHIELLLSGFAKVTTIEGDGEILLSIRRPGDIIGETGALGDRPRTATVTACGEATAAVVTKVEFTEFLRRHPDAALNMTAVIGERVRLANQRRADFHAYPAEIRLARLLVEIARTCGRHTDEGLDLGIPLSQPELATMAGAAEATAQKAIRDLKDGNLIRTGYRRIVIVDLDALLVLAGDTGRPWPGQPDGRTP